MTEGWHRALALRVAPYCLAGTVAARAGSAEPTSFEPPQVAETLSAVAPSVVRVWRSDESETGFVFGSRRHIVTSYFVVNASGDLRVVARDGVEHEARVVAWSKDVSFAASGQLQTEQRSRVRVRPALAFGFVESILFFQASVSEVPRVDVGLMFGR